MHVHCGNVADGGAWGQESREREKFMFFPENWTAIGSFLVVKLLIEPRKNFCSPSRTRERREELIYALALGRTCSSLGPPRS